MFAVHMSSLAQLMDLLLPIPLPDSVLLVLAQLPLLPLSLLALELANPLDVVCRSVWEALLQVLVALPRRPAVFPASLLVVVSLECRLRASLVVVVPLVDLLALLLPRDSLPRVLLRVPSNPHRDSSPLDKDADSLHPALVDGDLIVCAAA